MLPLKAFGMAGFPWVLSDLSGFHCMFHMACLWFPYALLIVSLQDGAPQLQLVHKLH